MKSETPHVEVRVGPISRAGGGIIDIRSIRAAKDLMEDVGRKKFANGVKSIACVWPSVNARWEGLTFVISGEVANG
jgi:hypothetical protein